MTGPIIPADQWPAWADRHCWDKNGDGWFYGPATPSAFAWFPYARRSNIPTPAGWDWSVPVIRADMGNPMSAPAIDLGQYAAAVQYAINGLLESGCMTDSVVAKKLRSLMAMIDGQARLNEPFGNPEQLPPCKIEKPRKGEGE